MVSVDGGFDVTEQFRSAHGSVDLLAGADLDGRSARRLMHIDAAALELDEGLDPAIRRLAATDQRELWVRAEHLSATAFDLRHAPVAVDSADDELLDEIEELHELHQAHCDRWERAQRVGTIVAAAAGALSVPAVGFIGIAAVLPLLMVVIATGIGCLVVRQLVARAERAEATALARLGAQSYLGFQIQRVNGLLDSDRGRRAQMRLAEAHRTALAEWNELTGDVGIDWALRHRDTIGTAARLRSEVFGLTAHPEREVADRGLRCAFQLRRRLDALRSVGASDENFTALLDEPFGHLEPGLVPALLELLVRSSERQQIVLMTDDAEIVSWARVEALTGSISIVEPVEPGNSGESGPTAPADLSAPAGERSHPTAW